VSTNWGRLEREQDEGGAKKTHHKGHHLHQEVSVKVKDLRSLLEFVPQDWDVHVQVDDGLDDNVTSWAQAVAIDATGRYINRHREPIVLILRTNAKTPEAG
jgi:hypothetical protein